MGLPGQLFFMVTLAASVSAGPNAAPAGGTAARGGSATPAAAATPAVAAARERAVAPGERWTICNGRFHRNGQWVFLKSGKLLRPFHEPETAAKVIADIDVLSSRLHYNNFSINIYPDAFDADGDSRIDPNREEAYRGIDRILDHCWARGVFVCLSFETYNIGGGEEITIRELAERIKQIVESDSQLLYVPYTEAYAPGFEDMQRRVPNTDRILALIGWQPETSLDEMLHHMRDHLRAGNGATAHS